jgi:hypothetical protein
MCLGNAAADRLLTNPVSCVKLCLIALAIGLVYRIGAVVLHAPDADQKPVAAGPRRSPSPRSPPESASSPPAACSPTRINGSCSASERSPSAGSRKVRRLFGQDRALNNSSSEPWGKHHRNRAVGAIFVRSTSNPCRRGIEPNRAALDVRLTTEDLPGLDRWFLPPTSKPATWSDFILDLGH